MCSNFIYFGNKTVYFEQLGGGGVQKYIYFYFSTHCINQQVLTDPLPLGNNSKYIKHC